MKKYFVISDVHSFYDEMIKALTDAGFDINNEEHIIISCGDIFDRGKKPLEVYNFLRNLPRERRILVRGNHELLLEDLVMRGYYESHDLHNGTYDTLCYVTKQPDYEHYLNNILMNHTFTPEWGTPEYEDYQKKEQAKRDARQKKLFKGRKIKEILAWINSDEWVDFYETKHYIFVHSFIPVKQFYNLEKSRFAGYLVKDKDDEYNSDWRNASHYEWNDAMWGCPWKKYKAGLFDEEIKNDKTLVCGHWHASDFWNNLVYADDKSKWLDTYENNPLFKVEGFNIIALDGCTAATGYVNVLVLDEEEL